MSEWHLELSGIAAYEINQVKTTLSFYVGEENAISRKKLLGKTTRLTDRELRLVIKHLRNDGCLICSRGGIGGGYWMAANLEELMNFINKELRSRALDMLRTAKHMEASGVHKLTRQIGMILGEQT